MAASSSTVDLSRLPAPTIVEQLDYETILARKVARVRELLPAFDATVDSDPAVKILQLAAYDELLLRQDFNDRCRRSLVAYATGADLDQRAALVGVARLEIAPADDVTGAPAVLEDDDSFRQRVVLAPEGYTVAGPELAYVKRAKDASGEVLDASATSPAPGEVLVSVLARTGDGAASPELVAIVAAVVKNKAVRPMGDAVTVASAAPVTFEVAASLTTLPGPDVALVLDRARESLDAYLAENRLLGRDITRAGLIAALAVTGVIDIALAAPAANVACDLTQVAHCTAIAVTHAGYAE